MKEPLKIFGWIGIIIVGISLSRCVGGCMAERRIKSDVEKMFAPYK